MASVTSLDKDIRKLRLDRYTPAAANEARAFIEESLGECLPHGDLLEGLKDGVALCKLVNLAVPNTLRFKNKAAMPFVQMENISLFLNACVNPPFNLQSHDMFLTVDLYDSKDPAQVLQCLSAFSRAAHRIEPSNFPAPIGGKSRSGITSPQRTETPIYGIRGRGVSNTSSSSSVYMLRPTLTPTRTGESNSGRWSPTKNSGTTSPGVSSWSKKEDEGATSPAWNIAQYGYMGGASQGNLGVSFGGRRQITSAGPYFTSLAEREKKRREKEAEEEKLRLEAEEVERQRREAEEIEERARIAEEERWAEEARIAREKERLKADEEKRRWEEEEQRWRIEEEQRQKEEREAEARLQEERQLLKSTSDARLRGQFLGQYQAENGTTPNGHSSESNRIKDLERELERARQREREYERERRAKLSHDTKHTLKDQDSATLTQEDSQTQPRQLDHVPIPSKSAPLPSTSPRPLPKPSLPPRLTKQHTGSRPLPDPAKYAATPSYQNRSDGYLAANAPSAQAKAALTCAAGTVSFPCLVQRDAEDQRLAKPPTRTRAGGWASNSLLEREMELERQRQREWEEGQREIKDKVGNGEGVGGGGVGGRWDVSQWAGYTGGDSQNRGTQGIESGRRQIVGPRPPPSAK